MSWLFFWRRRFEGPKRHSSQESELAPNAPFMAIKDEREVRRLNEQHFAIQQDLGGNYGAPLTSPKAILDIGCGTGRWAMAVAFPETQVIGIDVILPDPTDVARGGLRLSADSRSPPRARHRCCP